jgi:hypothetical protein
LKNGLELSNLPGNSLKRENFNLSN